jgi:hypothetical protein
MFSHRHQFWFSQKVVDGGGFMTARDEAHGRVLNELELFDVWWFAVWKPDSRGITHYRLNQGLVGDEERLLIVAPSRATNSLQKVEALWALGDDGKDVITKGELGVEDNAQNLWILVQRNVDVVNRDLRASPVLFTPRGEEGTWDLDGAIQSFFLTAQSTMGVRPAWSFRSSEARSESDSITVKSSA